eukprot:CAMPEP_0183714070 /NCGR_PEP_ID=MMETSP0737-20130205/8748_1 /TAXON_ID=385413 /ORGANISM="Thalassiosira miniscula, Strain CCMP1093" /LENGTH=392 /DNA_ID=CAMNT_0025942975 /DNA_START=537 /DNA_END=1715 /DNA_ORIENTATION=+
MMDLTTLQVTTEELDDWLRSTNVDDATKKHGRDALLPPPKKKRSRSHRDSKKKGWRRRSSLDYVSPTDEVFGIDELTLLMAESKSAAAADSEQDWREVSDSSFDIDVSDTDLRGEANNRLDDGAMFFRLVSNDTRSPGPGELKPASEGARARNTTYHRAVSREAPIPAEVSPGSSSISPIPSTTCTTSACHVKYPRSLSLPCGSGSGCTPSEAPIHNSSSNCRRARRRGSVFSFVSAMERSRQSQDLIGRATSSSRIASMRSKTAKSRGMLLVVFDDAAPSSSRSGTQQRGGTSGPRGPIHRRASAGAAEGRLLGRNRNHFPFSRASQFRNDGKGRPLQPGMKTNGPKNMNRNPFWKPVALKHTRGFDQKKAVQAELQRIAREMERSGPAIH